MEISKMTGYRTYIVSLLIAVFGTLNLFQWDVFFSDPKAGAVALGSAVIMAVMRSLTSTPPGKPDVK